MSWLDDLVEAAAAAETPSSYIFWSGIATISAIVSPNVYINRGGIYKLSPNVFVMLIGESGLGKGFPIAISKKLVKIVNNTRLISGRNTIQAIVKDLGTSETDPKTGVPKFKDARGYVVSGEFSTLVQEDKAALPILTELYDKHWNEDWKNTTKGAGIDVLHSPTITLLGGSTPEHFANVVPESDVKGGFVGRILTVYEEDRSKINPLEDTEAVVEFPFERLSVYLKELAKVKGDFKFSDIGRKFWVKWYTEVRGKKFHDPTGAINRLPDNVLKVAMCLSLSESPELIIDAVHIAEAVERCMALTVDSRRLTDGKGASELGIPTKLVIWTLFKLPSHEIEKGKLLRMHYGQFDTYSLDRIIVTLEQAGLAKCFQRDKKVWLKMPDEAVESLKKNEERIMVK